MGNPAKIETRATAILAAFMPPSKDCTIKAYQDYVAGVFCEHLSYEEARMLLIYYDCSIGELISHIVADKMGKG